MPRGLKRGNQYLPTEFEGSLLLSVFGFLCGRTALAVFLVSLLVGLWPFWVPDLRAVSGSFGRVPNFGGLTPVAKTLEEFVAGPRGVNRILRVRRFFFF